MQSSKLTQTLSFGLDIYTGSGDDLQTGCLEARRIRNETNRLDRAGWEWDDHIWSESPRSHRPKQQRTDPSTDHRDENVASGGSA